MGENIGYVRVSAVDQNVARQLDGVDLNRTFTDKASGKDTKRPQLQECLRFLRAGDRLHVHSMDRLARNLVDLQKMVEQLTGRGVSVQFHKEALTFTGDNDHMQKLMLQIMGAIAEFERANIRERQREGIAKAKASGKRLGRKAALDDDEVKEIVGRIEAGEERSAIARDFGITRQTLYRTLKKRGLEIAPARRPMTVTLRQDADAIAVILGMSDQGEKAQAIADQLNLRGLKRPDGNPWTAMTVGQARKRQSLF